jgi:HEAT repeat protein
MLAYLGEQLPPDRWPDPKRVTELVGQLGDRDFQVREAATAALLKFGPAVAPALREVRKATTSIEVARRVSTVLGKVGRDD